MATRQEMVEQKKAQQLLEKQRSINYKRLVKKENENAKRTKIAPEGVSISLQNINKVYPNLVQAVYDFNLDIMPKEFIVFVGPSGCGKSTTLRMIAGLEDITAGDLYISGDYANDRESKDRDVSMVFQSYALYPNMTVYDNLAFGLEVRHVPKDEIEQRVTEVAKILEISDYLNRKPGALSGGQRQRVALGRAIVKNAKVFLMDEPLSNLDAKLRVQMRSEIVRLHKEIGATTVYVTHDQTEAMTMASRIVVMKDGFIQQIGTPKEVYNNPSNVFVASFIGSPAMNITKATYNNGEIKLDNGFSIKLDKNKIKKHDTYYKNEIASINEKIDFLNKEISERVELLKDRNLMIHTENIEQITAKYEGMLIQYKNAKENIDPSKVDKIAKIDLKISNTEQNYQKALLKENERFKNVTAKTVNKNTNVMDESKQEKLNNIIAKDDLIEVNSLEVSKLEEQLKTLQNVLNTKSHEITFGIRPEDVTQESDKSMMSLPSESFDVDVVLSELLGNEYYVHFYVGETKFIAKVNSNTYKENTTKLKAVINLDKIHIFDPLTTKTIF